MEKLTMTAQMNTSEKVLRFEARTSVLSSFISPESGRSGTVSEIRVQTAGINDQPRLIATMSLAFSTDPAVRWMYPAPENYLDYFPQFVSAFGGRASECGTAHFIGDVQAAALWLPPSIQSDEDALMNLFERTIPEQNRQALFSMFEQMGDYHPHNPHWYLPLIGVEPIQQRRGYGSMMLEHALKVCDEDQMSAYLESSNPENIPLYQRHGFEGLGIIQAGAPHQLHPCSAVPTEKQQNQLLLNAILAF
jgi:ribosomal protein S18 acetylase RimI-like enzyme